MTDNEEIITIDNVIDAINAAYDVVQNYDHKALGEGVDYQLPQYQVISAMIKSKPDLDINAAMDLLGYSDDVRNTITANIQFKEREQDMVDRVNYTLGRLVDAIRYKGLTKASSRATRSAGNGTGTRTKVEGDFHAVCPICGKDYHGTQKSLALNNVKLHMEREHGIDADAYEEYRQQVKDSVYTIGETKRVEY